MGYFIASEVANPHKGSEHIIIHVLGSYNAVANPHKGSEPMRQVLIDIEVASCQPS